MLKAIVFTLLVCSIALASENGNGYDPPELINRTNISRGLVYTTHRHTKTVRDYSRLSNLVRSYPSTILIHTFRINPKYYQIRVVDAADYAPPLANIRSVVEDTGALGGINAGFFRRKRQTPGFAHNAWKAAPWVYDGEKKISSHFLRA